MGQQNQSITLQEFQPKDVAPDRKKIFKNSFKTRAFNQPQECILPRCNCPAKHRTIQNLKVCQKCQGSSGFPNFRKQEVLNYSKQSESLRERRHNPFRQTHYQPQKLIHQQVPLHYYNAWSLPIQPCLSEKITDSRALTAEDSYNEGQVHVPVKPVRKEPQVPRFDLDNQKKDESIVQDNRSPIDFQDVQDRGRRQMLFMF